ncbi:hypothetical protein AUK10_03100 [Candidatus Gracilibacteria bacterium CG2_30_37_12]|nr:MAG: hypothetical protein AUK10_03100 [Candidatus Gracilibacteria bacterium CG2_30_37_12]
MKTKNLRSAFIKRNTYGFTLVELIVVITILVILGTIAFMSLSGFSGSARDSSRVSDLANLSKSLEVANIKLGSYPEPDNHFFVAYSGGALWEQGTIGETVTNILKAGGVSLNRKPTDPLNIAKEYNYSRLAYGKAYQIKADYEGDSISFRNLPFVDQTYAASGDPQISYVAGNYNGVVAKTQTGGTTYVLAIPSLFINTSTGVVSIDTTTQTGFYILGQTNSGGTSFTPKLVYASGALPSATDSTGTLALAQSIANTYSQEPLLPLLHKSNPTQQLSQPTILELSPILETDLLRVLLGDHWKGHYQHLHLRQPMLLVLLLMQGLKL